MTRCGVSVTSEDIINSRYASQNRVYSILSNANYLQDPAFRKKRTMYNGAYAVVLHGIHLNFTGTCNLESLYSLHLFFKVNNLKGGKIMSRISKSVKKADADRRVNKTLHLDEAVMNFMGGTSYKVNPIDTLRMVAASSIFGEAQYYRSNVKDGRFSYHSAYSDDVADTLFSEYNNMTTTQVFEDVIDKALSYDFGKTLELAVQLRTMYNMRLNPQVIMVRASIHKDRQAWSEKNPGEFARINKLVMSRADEPATQVAYYMYINDGKKNMPSILKRSIADKLSGLNRYQVNKYKNSEIGMIDTARIVHASSDVLSELMRTGTVEVQDSKELTWEQKRSAGMSWREIVETTNLGHMAMLRNLNNIFSEVEDSVFCDIYLAKLKAGVLDGKQFPFRYYTAYQKIKDSSVNHQAKILDALEECIDISIANMPKLKGKTMCLSDNSGSAWDSFTSEYGDVTVGLIDNLSSVIAAMASDEGYVGKFGDKLKRFAISKRNGALKQAEDISRHRDNDVGGGTEGGIWLFFRDAIKKKEYFDNIFIFSDEQAGTGGLYGTSEQADEYGSMYATNTMSWRKYINVYKLILEYRKQVNPKVNVFAVQTAGYKNVLVPEMSYRTSMLTGWTGKELLFADEYIKIWDDIESRGQN